MIDLIPPARIRDIEAPPAIVATASTTASATTRTGRAFLRRDYDNDRAVEFIDIDPIPSSPTQLYFGAGDTIRHELDAPDAPPLKPSDLDGRRVRVAVHDSTRYEVTILGGPSMAAFDATVGAELSIRAAMEELCGGSHRPVPLHRTDLDVVIEAGMGSRQCPIREATQGVLERMGLRAVPALVRGLGSKDPEVRVRCERALWSIRNGGGE